MTASLIPGFPDFPGGQPRVENGNPAPPRRPSKSKLVFWAVLSWLLELSVWTAFVLVLSLVAGVPISLRVAIALGWAAYGLTNVSGKIARGEL